jgi:hypothetical protein
MIGRSLAAYLRPTGLTYNSTAAGSPRRSGLVDAVLWVGAVALSEDALAPCSPAVFASNTAHTFSRAAT